MNSTWTALLVLPALASPVPRPPSPGANKVRLGTTDYVFHPEQLILSTPSARMRGQRLFRLSGRLVPATGEAIVLELTATEAGSIYLLSLMRARANGRDVWAATMKTKAEVLELQAKAGGNLRVRLSGPLAATLENGGSFTQWSGEIQTRFNGISE